MIKSNLPAPKFRLGDKVFKRTGSYDYDGEVVGLIRKKSGEWRYAVEDDRGLLLIMSCTQLMRGTAE